jgi:hypothetical protein
LSGPQEQAPVEKCSEHQLPGLAAAAVPQQRQGGQPPQLLLTCTPSRSYSRHPPFHPCTQPLQLLAIPALAPHPSTVLFAPQHYASRTSTCADVQASTTAQVQQVNGSAVDGAGGRSFTFWDLSPSPVACKSKQGNNTVPLCHIDAPRAALHAVQDGERRTGLWESTAAAEPFSCGKHRKFATSCWNSACTDILEPKSATDHTNGQK